MSASQAEIVSPNPKTSAESQAVIRTVDLTKVYPGGVKAVDTLNLTVAQGEIFGLLGPNGAGKTTTNDAGVDAGQGPRAATIPERTDQQAGRQERRVRAQERIVRGGHISRRPSCRLKRPNLSVCRLLL
jgi:ABC-type branched-subunit amino acid transport system ATPase component